MVLRATPKEPAQPTTQPTIATPNIAQPSSNEPKADNTETNDQEK